jgi:hypothetical protein
LISSALPADNLRLDRPFLLKGLPLRSDKRKLRALDSTDSQAPRPARKGICFYAPLYAVPLRSKDPNPPKEIFLMQKINRQPAFEPGEFLTRHVNREWCDLSDEHRSLERGFRLLRSYRTNAGDKLWIITESDRSVTALLLPEEY